MPSLLSYTLGKYGFTEITLKPSDIFWFSFSQDLIKRRLKIGDEVSNLFFICDSQYFYSDDEANIRRETLLRMWTKISPSCREIVCIKRT